MIDFHLVCYSEKELNSVVNQMKNPRLGLEISDRQSVFGIITNRKCFVATKAVKWLDTRFGWSSLQSLFFMRLLQVRQIIHHCGDRDAKFDDDESLWRFQSDEKGPLNWNFVWTSYAEGDPNTIVETLLAKLFELVRGVALMKKNPTSEESMAALARVNDISAYIKFQKEICILQKVKPQFSSEAHKKAFWINVYNMLAVHSLIARAIEQYERATASGVPVTYESPYASFFSRKQFFSENVYIINGETFSLDDIESGILRKTDYFKENDPRNALQIEERDFRIHCCLGSLIKSSPRPVIIYHHWAEWYIDLATKAFLSTMVVDQNKAILPKIITRFNDDFMISRDTIAQVMAPYLSLALKNKLGQAMKMKGFEIEYSPHNFDISLESSYFALIDI